jgi:hypothetical protein
MVLNKVKTKTVKRQTALCTPTSEPSSDMFYSFNGSLTMFGFGHHYLINFYFFIDCSMYVSTLELFLLHTKSDRTL